MRRPVSVKSVLSLSLSFFFLLLSSLFQLFPWSQAASVATLPSALFFERLSLGASWVYSIQQVLLPDNRPLFPLAKETGPLLTEIESLNARIAEYDRRIEQIAKEVHPEVALLRQVKGVGPLISLTFVLTLDDPQRFRRSRDVGCFLGLRPGRGTLAGVNHSYTSAKKETVT